MGYLAGSISPGQVATFTEIRNGIKPVEDERFERFKGLPQESLSHRQAFLALVLRVAFLPGSGLVDEMIMVPRQHEEIQGWGRNPGLEFRLNRFQLFKRDDQVIQMLAKGLQRAR